MNKDIKISLIKIIVSVSLGAIAIVLFNFISLPFWVKLLIWIFIYLITGFDVLKAAFLDIIHGQLLDEKFLMSIASIGAFFVDEYVEAAGVMIFYCLGEMVQNLAVSKSRSRIKNLAKERVLVAHKIIDNKPADINPKDIEIGDILEVKPGEKIPVDGVIISGITNINAASITGESLPITASQNDEVFSGTICVDGVVRIKATKTFFDSTSEKIIELVEDSTLNKSKTEKFITKFANVYTPLVVIMAAFIAIVPSIAAGNWNVWISRALLFLVVSCPCALVISIPMAFFAGVGNCSKKGLLVKGCDYLEKLADISAVVLDKTGTVTTGEFEVFDCHVSEGQSKEELLKVTLSGEATSNHPIAKSLTEYCKSQGATAKETEEFDEIPGLGIRFEIDGNKFTVGSRWNVITDLPGSVIVTKNNKILGTFEIKDKIKNDSSMAVAEMKKLGVKNVIILSGDSKKQVEDTYNECGADLYLAELKPADKVNQLKQIIEKEKGSVVYAGDGINDAPVLALADVGIAMGGIGQDAAVEASDAVSMNDSLCTIAEGIRTAKKTVVIARENIILAIGIKVLILLLSVIGFGNMFLAVFADVGVCVLAVLNSSRLINFKR